MISLHLTSDESVNINVSLFFFLALIKLSKQFQVKKKDIKRKATCKCCIKLPTHKKGDVKDGTHN